MHRLYTSLKWFGEVRYVPMDRILTLLYVAATLVFVYLYAY